MEMTKLVVLGLVFLAVAGVSLALAGLLAPRPVKARLRQIAGEGAFGADSSDKSWRHKVVAAVAPAGKLSLPKDGWEGSSLRLRFIQAGLRSEHAPLGFFAAKTLLTFALPLLFMFYAGVSRIPLGFNAVLMVIVLLAAVGYYFPNIYLRRRIANRKLEIFESFPDAIDLLRVAVEAGMGLDAAIARVSQEIGTKSDVLEEELRLVGLELRAGASREQALRNLALRTGVQEVELFVAMLVQSDRFGTSMSEALRVHSDELRNKRRLKAEEAAAKIALKLLFPLALFIFPAMLLVMLGPAAISVYRIFFPIATGGS